MKRLHQFLKVFIFVQLGSCAGRVLERYLDYINHPALYATWSAPWYSNIILTLIFTAITVAITVVAYFIVGHIIKKKQTDE